MRATTGVERWKQKLDWQADGRFNSYPAGLRANINLVNATLADGGALKPGLFPCRTEKPVLSGSLLGQKSAYPLRHQAAGSQAGVPGGLLAHPMAYRRVEIKAWPLICQGLPL